MHFADNNTGLNQLQHSDLQKAVKNAVNDLPEQCRKIFVLSRFSGKKYAEIAEELNLSVKTVEAQMSIAFKRLRVALVDFMTILVVIGIATFFH
jgi:RNA polymerase sigma-70 factor (ECF subfamily)